MLGCCRAAPGPCSCQGATSSLKPPHPALLLLLGEMQTSLICSYLQLGLSSPCAEVERSLLLAELARELAAEPRREAVSSWAGAASSKGKKRLKGPPHLCPEASVAAGLCSSLLEGELAAGSCWHLYFQGGESREGLANPA